MAVRDRNIQEVDDDHKDQEHTDVEDDYVDVPIQPLQPVDYAEGTQKLSEVFNYILCFPNVNHLYLLLKSK
jgi:hypothetical protein